MKVLLNSMIAVLLMLAPTFQAGASEPDNKKAVIEIKEQDKGRGDELHPGDQTGKSPETVHKKKSNMTRGKVAESKRDVSAIDTEETVKRILESSQRSERKKKPSSHKKKPLVAAENHSTDSSHDNSSVDAEEAAKRLLEGNRRYTLEKNSAGHRTAKRRTEVTKAQHPFAIIVGCSDSRVPPEIIFDQGVGDLFVIRTAGNVVDDIAIGSIEYAVEHLGVQLIMVLGHERCGAVDATLKGAEAGGKLKSVVNAIRPAVEKAKARENKSHDCDLLCSSVRSNARMVAEKLRSSSTVLAEAFENGLLRAVGAYYDLDSGIVTLTYKPYL